MITRFETDSERLGLAMTIEPRLFLQGALGISLRLVLRLLIIIMGQRLRRFVTFKGRNLARYISYVTGSVHGPTDGNARLLSRLKSARPMIPACK